eukprot:1769814-Rhodomonas_salina.2
MPGTDISPNVCPVLTYTSAPTQCPVLTYNSVSPTQYNTRYWPNVRRCTQAAHAPPHVTTARAWTRGRSCRCVALPSRIPRAHPLHLAYAVLPSRIPRAHPPY